MNKYNIYSLTTVISFIIMFFAMFSRISLGSFGKLYIILMFLFPLLGIILGFKAEKGVVKWLLILLNILALCVIGYLLLLAYGISEN